MGVLGITPFLQKICPNVFTTLPDRLRALAGKTVVIDATLVTQRLHFSPMPHPHRHLIGWHRILAELRDADVRAICVFDSQQRSAAKAREVARRREARRIDAARGSIELTRLRRLEKLMRLVPYYRALPGSDRQRINDALSSITSACGSLDAHASGPTLFPSESPPHSSPPKGFDMHDLQDVLDPVAFPSRSDPPPSAITDDDAGSCDLSVHPHDILPSLPFVHWNAAVQPTLASLPPPDSIESCRSELSALCSEYSRSVGQLTSMPSSFDGPEIPERDDERAAPADIPGHEHDFDASIEYAMSKQQLQMTLDEGHIWHLLSSPSPIPPNTESALAALAERSTAISRSYRRRSNAPTSQTYDECKALVRAMGVPCIDALGPVEAEALACALVLQGPADYVASEDTDVLIYEAPLLRGITARKSPLVLVHGDAIRAALALDRASYLDFALLLGTDFSQRIKHIGPSRALKFIREHGSIEGVVTQESKYPPRVPAAEYLAQVEVARLVFQHLPPLPEPETLHQGEVDADALSEIIQRYQLQRMLPDSWDAQAALAGNYFGDDPSVW